MSEHRAEFLTWEEAHGKLGKIDDDNELHLLQCGKCGNVLFRPGDGFKAFIPTFHYECLKCGSRGVFDGISVDREAEV